MVSKLDETLIFAGTDVAIGNPVEVLSKVNPAFPPKTPPSLNCICVFSPPGVPTPLHPVQVPVTVRLVNVGEILLERRPILQLIETVAAVPPEDAEMRALIKLADVTTLRVSP